MIDVLDLLFVLASQLNLFDDVVLLLLEVGGEVSVTKCPESQQRYPCPIIFKISYSFIIYSLIISGRLHL